jgi:hypothetical protein
VPLRRKYDATDIGRGWQIRGTPERKKKSDA